MPPEAYRSKYLAGRRRIAADIWPAHWRARRSARSALDALEVYAFAKASADLNPHATLKRFLVQELGADSLRPAPRIPDRRVGKHRPCAQGLEGTVERPADDEISPDDEIPGLLQNDRQILRVERKGRLAGARPEEEEEVSDRTNPRLMEKRDEAPPHDRVAPNPLVGSHVGAPERREAFRLRREPKELVVVVFEHDPAPALDRPGHFPDDRERIAHVLEHEPGVNEIEASPLVPRERERLRFPRPKVHEIAFSRRPGEPIGGRALLVAPFDSDDPPAGRLSHRAGELPESAPHVEDPFSPGQSERFDRGVVQERVEPREPLLLLGRRAMDVFGVRHHRMISSALFMISFSRIFKQYGRQILFVDASFQLNPGEKVGLVGPNGAGKTTLFRMITGEEHADDGDVSVPKKLAVGYFRQEIDEMAGRSVLDEAIAGSGRLGDLHHELESIEHALADPARSADMEATLARFGEVQEEYQQKGGYELEARAREVLHGLGFEDGVIDADVAALSGGWKMRVSMAKVLLGKPDVLLLDEPTNHLDIESILWLEEFLKESPASLLMTCHDRDFMNRVVSRVVEIDGGELIAYTGNYDFYERERQLREAQREAAYARQQAMFAKEQRFIERFSAHAAKAAQVQSRVKKLDKIEAIELPRRRQAVSFAFPRPPRSGDEVAALQDVTKGYGSRRLYDGFDFLVRRGERWCVMGRNGAGKTTLLKMVAGVLPPDGGSVKLGASLTLGYFAQQSLDLLDPALTVIEQIESDFPHDSPASIRSLLGAFQFSGDDVDKPVRALSGGERSRLVMARILFHPPNFLVLDEPTNHLDLATKEMLVAALADFEGTMLFVSHDRTFLRGLANRVLEVGGGEPPHAYTGSYREYVAATGREAPGVHA